MAIKSKLLDLRVPQVCGICGKLNEKSLCKKCEILLNKQSAFEIQDYTENFEMNFDEHLYVFGYEGIIRKKMLDYKFNEKSYLYRTFSNYILQNESFCELLKKYDVIIPVPISNGRLRTRGYNQSFLIAKELSKNLNIKLVDNCLFKIKNIAPQSKLNKEERFQNIEGVYKLKNQNILKDKNILIFDDIFTTGSTVNECSKILMEACPKKIGVLTIAKG